MERLSRSATVGRSGYNESPSLAVARLPTAEVGDGIRRHIPVLDLAVAPRRRPPRSFRRGARLGRAAPAAPIAPAAPGRRPAPPPGRGASRSGLDRARPHVRGARRGREAAFRGSRAGAPRRDPAAPRRLLRADRAGGRLLSGRLPRRRLPAVPALPLAVGRGGRAAAVRAAVLSPDRPPRRRADRRQAGPRQGFPGGRNRARRAGGRRPRALVSGSVPSGSDRPRRSPGLHPSLPSAAGMADAHAPGGDAGRRTGHGLSAAGAGGGRRPAGRPAPPGRGGRQGGPGRGRAAGGGSPGVERRGPDLGPGPDRRGGPLPAPRGGGRAAPAERRRAGLPAARAAEP